MEVHNLGLQASPFPQSTLNESEHRMGESHLSLPLPLATGDPKEYYDY